MAAETVIINKFGRMAGASQVQLVLYGRTVEGITMISYDDTVEKEAVLGMGKYPLGTSEGQYKAKVELEMYAEELHAILRSAPQGTRLQDIPATDVPCLYEFRDRIDKDVIKGFEFTGITKEVKSGDKVIKVKVGCFCTHIDWLVQ